MDKLFSRISLEKLFFVIICVLFKLSDNSATRMQLFNLTDCSDPKYSAIKFMDDFSVYFENGNLVHNGYINVTKTIDNTLEVKYFSKKI